MNQNVGIVATMKIIIIPEIAIGIGNESGSESEVQTGRDLGTGLGMAIETRDRPLGDIDHIRMPAFLLYFDYKTMVC